MRKPAFSLRTCENGPRLTKSVILMCFKNSEHPDKLHYIFVYFGGCRVSKKMFFLTFLKIYFNFCTAFLQLGIVSLSLVDADVGRSDNHWLTAAMFSCPSLYCFTIINTNSLLT